MAKPIGMILQEWADLDIFYYALPFLLIFALVFAILQKIKIMGGDAKDNRGVSAVIALAIALLALQFDYVSVFFQVLFPKLGIGLAILLAAMILTGLFVDFQKKSGAAYIFFVLGAIIFIVIIIGSFNDYSWWTGSFWAENMSAIIAGLILVSFVGIVISSGGDHNAPPFPLREYTGH